ncbi:MAG: hypothetical protein C4293_14635, partial [Nitrospiraceae bacterium]
MNGSFTKWLVSFVVPGGLLVVATGVILSTTSVPHSFRPLLSVAPSVVFVVGLLLGWFFNRSRVVFGVLLLALAYYALLSFPALGS